MWIDVGLANTKEIWWCKHLLPLCSLGGSWMYTFLLNYLVFDAFRQCAPFEAIFDCCGVHSGNVLNQYRQLGLPLSVRAIFKLLFQYSVGFGFRWAYAMVKAGRDIVVGYKLISAFAFQFYIWISFKKCYYRLLLFLTLQRSEIWHLIWMPWQARGLSNLTLSFRTNMPSFHIW